MKPTLLLLTFMLVGGNGWACGSSNECADSSRKAVTYEGAVGYAQAAAIFSLSEELHALRQEMKEKNR